MPHVALVQMPRRCDALVLPIAVARFDELAFHFGQIILALLCFFEALADPARSRDGIRGLSPDRDVKR